MVFRRRRVGRRRGGGGGVGDALAGRAHAECGWGSHVHVELRRQLQSSQLLYFLLQPPVLVCEGLAASFQELTVHLCLLQLRSEITPRNEQISILRSQPNK